MYVVRVRCLQQSSKATIVLSGDGGTLCVRLPAVVLDSTVGESETRDLLIASPSLWPTTLSGCKKQADLNKSFALYGSVAQWLGRWACDWRSRVQSQSLHCRVRFWTSCSHTLSSASQVSTLWRYINQFIIKFSILCKISQTFPLSLIKLSGYLIVSQAQPSDSGVYRCLASNALGNATAPARVIVTGM